MSRRNLIEIVLLILVVGASFWIYDKRSEIRDWWFLRSYNPPAEIVALADDSSMSEPGRRIFYASNPVLADSETFNTACPFPDRSLVLGCFSNYQIYVFDVDDERLAGIEEVTAAHEMLHAVYARLDSSTRERIDELTQSAFAAIEDERLNETVESYRTEDPSSVPNELHSILGTEIADLPPELEAHYSRYFINRSVVVALAQSYEQTFTDIQDKIADYDRQIAELRSQIDAAEASLSAEQSELAAESERLNNLRNSGQIAEYNAGVPGYNSRVNAYNQSIENYKDLVNRHNRLVKERNELALEQNELVRNLDSRFEEIEN